MSSILARPAPWVPILLLSCLLIFPAAGATAAVPLVKLDPALRIMLQDHAAPGTGLATAPPTSATDGRVDVFIQGHPDRTLLEAHGAEPRTLLPGLATARVPIAALEALSRSPLVDWIQAGSSFEFLMDETATETMVQEAWGGAPPAFPPDTSLSRTGRGVLLGVVDTGIDWGHEDFKNGDGTSRIVSLWDQTYPGPPYPSGFTYGREWTSEQLAVGQCTSYDTNGHGTHVAGTAAGNGRATGNGYPAYRYVGMAPEAGIVVVKVGSTDTNILDAVNYVFSRATALGRDAVVCVAAGKQSGPHDGTDPLDVGIDALSGPGRIVVTAAGNDWGQEIHGGIQVPSGGTNQVHVRVPTTVGTYWGEVLLEGWYDPGASLSLSVISPNGYRWGPVEVGGSSQSLSPDGRVTLFVQSTSTGPIKAYIRLYGSSGESTPLAWGDWTIEAAVTSGPARDVDFWMVRRDPLSYVDIVEWSPDECITSPGTAGNAITAAAYCVKKNWTDVTGNAKGYANAVPDDVAYFSNQGPRRDGLQKPDIAASGFGVASSRSTRMTVSSWQVVEDGVHYMLFGTSTAAAVVAGTVALLLEEYPGLDPASAKNILVARAFEDSFTGAVPNTRWGGGKLRVSSPGAVTAVEDLGGPPEESGRAFTLGSPFPNPASARLLRIPVELKAGADVRLAVYDVSGREVSRLFSGWLEPGVHVFNWDGNGSQSQPVVSGRYYAVIANETARQSRAILLLR